MVARNRYSLYLDGKSERRQRVTRMGASHVDSIAISRIDQRAGFRIVAAS